MDRAVIGFASGRSVQVGIDQLVQETSEGEGKRIGDGVIGLDHVTLDVRATEPAYRASGGGELVEGSIVIIGQLIIRRVGFQIFVAIGISQVCCLPDLPKVTPAQKP